MARSDNVMELPKNLPVPQDDGACDHLTGMALPQIELYSTHGRTVDLSSRSHDLPPLPLPVRLEQLSVDAQRRLRA